MPLTVIVHHEQCHFSLRSRSPVDRTKQVWSTSKTLLKFVANTQFIFLLTQRNFSINRKLKFPTHCQFQRVYDCAKNLARTGRLT